MPCRSSLPLLGGMARSSVTTGRASASLELAVARCVSLLALAWNAEEGDCSGTQQTSR